jgi:anti-sigma factor RsiW
MRLRFRRSRAHDLTCRQAVGLMMNYLDGLLDDTDRARLEDHLVDCPHCTEYIKQLQVTVTATGQLQVDQLDPAAREDLVNLYRRWRGAEA